MRNSLVGDSLEIECLIQALQNAVEAKVTHDRERDSYDDYSWGYYGRGYVDDMEKAADEFGNRLNALIDARIQAALARVG